ncbi:MAG: hydrolase [Eubacteriales bacterium]|nr:hydrolase [Eubacteriales bacterium]
MATIEENIKRFEELLGSVKRDGMENLIKYIKNHTDFYSAPASTRFHLACEGGLLQHSLNVYDCLTAKKDSVIWGDILKEIPEENLIIMALLHDLCKTNFYVEGTKNQKTYDAEKVEAAEPWQRKHDKQGDFIWETVKTYQIEDQLPLGHGEKSVMLIQCYIRLSMQEVMAIRWHMGFSEEKVNYGSVGAAMEKYPVVLALHEADLEASKILERDM